MAQHYDVAVIGTQPAGVITASLLAKRGRRVLLVDHGENATSYSHQGLRLPLVPYLVPQLESSPAMVRVHEELALGPELRAVTKPLAPSFQAVMPQHRFDIAATEQALRAEFALEFPDVATAVNSFFTRLFALDDEISTFLSQHVPLIPQTLADRWRARSKLAKARAWDAPFETQQWLVGIPEDHQVRDVLLSPLQFFGHLSHQPVTTFQAVRLIARYFRGTVEFFQDRLGGLEAFLLNAAKSSGVDVRQGAEVKGLETRGRMIQQLDLEGDRLPYTADYFIANTFSPFQELLPAGNQQARFSLEEQEVRPVGSLLVLNLVVGSDVIPYGMGQALFLLNGRRTPRGENPPDSPLLLQRFPAEHTDRPMRTKVKGKEKQKGKDRESDSKEQQPTDCEVMSIACPVRTAEVVHSPDRLAALKTQLIARVARVVPFLSRYQREVSLPIDTASWDLEADGKARRVDPWRLHPIYESARRPLLGVSTRGPRTYYKNLWHCGRDVIPGLGIEGEYMSGLATADAIVRDAGRKWSERRLHQ